MEDEVKVIEITTKVGITYHNELNQRRYDRRLLLTMQLYVSASKCKKSDGQLTWLSEGF